MGRLFALLTRILLALLAFHSVGCAMSKPGNCLPLRALAPDPSHPQVPVDYETKWITQMEENPAAKTLLDASVKRSFAESQLFSRFAEAKGNARYHFIITMQNHGDMAAAKASGFASGLTLSLIPATARDHYLLEVEVQDNEKTLRRFSYREYIDTTIGAFMIFAPASRRPANVVAQVVDNMMRTFLFDFAKLQLEDKDE